MKILFIGDVVGSPGREMVEEYLPKLKEKYTSTYYNCKWRKCCRWKGITEKIYRNFLECGAKYYNGKPCMG